MWRERETKERRKRQKDRGIFKVGKREREKKTETKKIRKEETIRRERMKERYKREAEIDREGE